MHDSMIIAEVGDIENVNGSRIATPLAPPRPGSTPTITPRMMPTTISTRLNGCKTTEKPWSRLPISSNISLSPLTRRPSHGGGPQTQYPRRFSSGPFGKGTRNQTSNIRNVRIGTTTPTGTATSQLYLPSHFMNAMISSADDT